MTNRKEAMEIEKERKVVSLMIDLYCKKKHKTKSLCKECQELKDYCNLRLDKCPFKDNKTFCSSCKIHCYRKDMQEKIKKVMKFSGPRMLIYHPIVALSHVKETLKHRKEVKNGKKQIT